MPDPFSDWENVPDEMGIDHAPQQKIEFDLAAVCDLGIGVIRVGQPEVANPEFHLHHQ